MLSAGQEIYKITIANLYFFQTTNTIINSWKSHLQGACSRLQSMGHKVEQRLSDSTATKVSSRKYYYIQFDEL